MGRLSKLIVVDNLGCPKCKRNSAEFLEKKNNNLPSNKEDMLESFNIDCVRTITFTVKSYTLACRTTTWEAPNDSSFYPYGSGQFQNEKIILNSKLFSEITP